MIPPPTASELNVPVSDTGAWYAKDAVGVRLGVTFRSPPGEPEVAITSDPPDGFDTMLPGVPYVAIGRAKLATILSLVGEKARNALSPLLSTPSARYQRLPSLPDAIDTMSVSVFGRG
jgi:hypothetical protein